MKSKKHGLVILLTTATLANCSNSKDSEIATKAAIQSRIAADSVELTSLVRNVYEWHETKYQNHGFPLKLNIPSDSLFVGIDWKAYNKDYEAFRKTNFFSDDFLARHRAIAMTIDSSIRQAGVEWRNAKDGIPLWSTDADDWCSCQDSPDNYWERLIISNFRFSKDAAAFNWGWGLKDGIDPPFKYEMKAKKVNGAWRVSYMEGFKYYGTVADYNKIMSRSKN